MTVVFVICIAEEIKIKLYTRRAIGHLCAIYLSVLSPATETDI